MKENRVAKRETISEVRADRDYYKKLADERFQPIINAMRLENGGFNMEVTGEVSEVISMALIGHFKAGGSINYMEMSLHDVDDPFKRYTVTVQKVGAKSPADLVNDARARISELERALAGVQS